MVQKPITTFFLAIFSILSGACVSEARSLQSGLASWYGPGFHGRRTASGERFNTYELTAAHRTLAFGSRVRVTNAHNGRSVVVRINDRGPFIRGRVIDLSKASARAIGMSGTAPVRLARLSGEEAFSSEVGTVRRNKRRSTNRY